MGDLKPPGSDQVRDHLIDGLPYVFSAGEPFSQPHVQRMRLRVVFKDIVLLALDDVVPSGVPNVVDKFRDIETSLWPSVGQLDEGVHNQTSGLNLAHRTLRRLVQQHLEQMLGLALGLAVLRV